MMNQPPIVVECPSCGERYLLPNAANKPSEHAIHYSDGYFTDELVWRTPGIIGCVTCDLGFFPEQGKVIAQPDWETFYAKWSHLKKAEPPAAGALALEIRVRKVMTPETEIVIRKELWYAGNHTGSGKLFRINNPKFNLFWLENLKRLEEIHPDKNPDDCLLKAEMNRQLGNMETCLLLLASLNSAIANQIRSQSTGNNLVPFILHL